MAGRGGIYRTTMRAEEEGRKDSSDIYYYKFTVLDYLVCSVNYLGHLLRDKRVYRVSGILCCVLLVWAVADMSSNFDNFNRLTEPTSFWKNVRRVARKTAKASLPPCKLDHVGSKIPNLTTDTLATEEGGKISNLTANTLATSTVHSVRGSATEEEEEDNAEKGRGGGSRQTMEYDSATVLQDYEDDGDDDDDEPTEYSTIDGKDEEGGSEVGVAGQDAN